MNLQTALELKEQALDQFDILPGAQAFRLHDAVSRAMSIGGSVAAATRVDRAVERFGGPAVETVGRVVDTARSKVSAMRRLYGLGVAVCENGEFGLAVRYPWSDESMRPNLDELQQMAGGEIDPQWTGPVVAQSTATVPPWHRGRQRPLLIGSSIAHRDSTAGTLTGFVKRGDGSLEALSCNHVLTVKGGALLDPVLQPGPADNGEAANTVGQVAHIIPLQKRTVNLVDCALVGLSTGIESDRTTLTDYGPLGGVVPAGWFETGVRRRAVAKLGRTTGPTEGHITAIALTQRVAYAGLGSFFFNDLMEIRGRRKRPFSEPGDSGSLVFSPSDGNRACGMVIAGTGVWSYATRLDTVLSQLGAELVTM